MKENFQSTAQQVQNNANIFGELKENQLARVFYSVIAPT